MRRQRRAIQTRDAVLHGAATVFEAKGYANASLGEICAAAGVTSGALYFHFPSKEAVAVAVIEEQHRRSYETGKHLEALNYSALETMLRMSRSLAQDLTGNLIVKAGIKLTLEAHAFTDSLDKPYLDWMHAHEQLLLQAQTEGDIRDDIDPLRLAEFIIPSFTGIQHVANLLNGRTDLLPRILQMWDLIIQTSAPATRVDCLRDLAERVFTPVRAAA